MAFLHSRVLNKRLYGWIIQLQEFDFVIEYRPGGENSDADALSRQSWDSTEGDPWRPAAIEECEQQDLMLRPAVKPWEVGGDVGTDDSPHKRRKEKDRKEKDVVGQAHQEVDTEEGQRQCEQEQGHCSQGCKRNT